MASSSCPNNDFADSIRGIGFALRVLRREAFIGMFVPGKNQVGVSGVQVFPQWLQFRMYCVPLEDPAAEDRMMPIRSSAAGTDRKSTRLNSSHANIPYAVFCLQKKHLTDTT